VNLKAFAKLAILITFSVALIAGSASSQTFPVLRVPQSVSPSMSIGRGIARFQMPSSSLGSDPAVENPEREIPTTFKGWLNRGLRDQKELLLAPFHKKNLIWDALFLAGTGTLIAYDEQAARAVPRDWESASHWASNAAIVSTSLALGTVFLRGLKTDNEHAKEMGYLGLEALSNAFLIYTPMQLLAARERPFEGTGEGAFFKNHSVNTGFPAGHAMFSWVMATTVAHEYPKPWVQALAYGAALTVTGARFTGRNHFPSDLLVGSVLGYFIGTHIFHSHCKFGLSPACHPRDKRE